MSPRGSLPDKVLRMKRRSEEKKKSSPDLELVFIALARARSSRESGPRTVASKAKLASWDSGIPRQFRWDPKEVSDRGSFVGFLLTAQFSVDPQI